MGFLLTKILFLLVLAAASGALLAYWWFRRHYEDVTLDYARSREEWDAWRRGFEERLAARPAVDLEPLTQQLSAVHAAVSDIDIPIPERVDLSPLHARLEDLTRRVGDIQLPAPDLGSTDARLTAIEHALFPLDTRLDELASAVRALRTPPPAATAAEVVSEAAAPSPESLDTSLDAAAEAAAERPAEAPPEAMKEEASLEAVRDGSRNLLTHPSHGKPDDLTRIKGVAKVLEHTLHKVGVFYFWQIAEWSPEDVRHVDSQLTGFHGRIESDEWVSQANALAALPSATPRPREH
jgi:predicted flap endonuclease-1-like 5' DNA nuclease